MSDDTPTVSFPESPGVFQRPPTRPRPPRRSNGPVILFAILAALVVAAVIVLIVILDGRLASQNSASPSGPPTAPSSAGTSSAAASPAPVKTTVVPPPVVAPAGTFTSFIVPQAQGGCGRHGDPTVQVTWSTSNAKTVWIEDGTVDAAGGGGTQLPLAGNQSDVPDTVTVDCGQRMNTYSITLVGADGAHVTKSWTIRVGGHRF